MEGSDGRENSIRVVVLGQTTVGKSSITVRFTQNAFADEYMPTVQDTYRKNFALDG